MSARSADKYRSVSWEANRGGVGMGTWVGTRQASWTGTWVGQDSPSEMFGNRFAPKLVSRNQEASALALDCPSFGVIACV
jgi:hypothetical protein